jgi:hypothetical protein
VIPCDSCGTLPFKPLRCACGTAFYCSTECQRKVRKAHKVQCNTIIRGRNKPENNRPVIPDSLRYPNDNGVRECLICFENVEKKEQQRFGECAHTFCISCSRKHYDSTSFADRLMATIEVDKPSPVTCPLCRAPHKSKRNSAENPPNDPARAYYQKMQENASIFSNCDAEYEDLAHVVLRANGVLEDEEAVDNLEFLEGMRFAAEGLDKIIKEARPEDADRRLLPVNLSRIEVHAFLHEWEDCLALCKRSFSGVLSLPNVPSKAGADGMTVSEESKDDYRMQTILIIIQSLIKLKRLDEVPEYYNLLHNYLNFKKWELAGGEDYNEAWSHTNVTASRTFRALSALYFCEVGRHEDCIELSKEVIWMNCLYRGIYTPMARSQRAMGDLEGAIETMREAVKREEPWNVPNTRRLEVYLKELVDGYNEKQIEAVKGVGLANE